MDYTAGVVGADGTEVVAVADGVAETAEEEPEDAPKRCCNNSAIRMVVLSIADLGR